MLGFYLSVVHLCFFACTVCLSSVYYLFVCLLMRLPVPAGNSSYFFQFPSLSCDCVAPCFQTCPRTTSSLKTRRWARRWRDCNMVWKRCSNFCDSWRRLTSNPRAPSPSPAMAISKPWSRTPLPTPFWERCHHNLLLFIYVTLVWEKFAINWKLAGDGIWYTWSSITAGIWPPCFHGQHNLLLPAGVGFLVLPTAGGICSFFVSFLASILDCVARFQSVVQKPAVCSLYLDIGFDWSTRLSEGRSRL